MAANYNMKIEQGATYSLQILYQTDPEGENIDLRAEWTARLDIRGDIADPNPLAELSTENGKIMLGDGVIDLLITAAETAAYPTVNGVYDLNLYRGDFVSRVMMGSVFISGEVTR